jgi:hypothetical protein
MKNVISIFTKEALEELPFKEAAALGVIKHLLAFKADSFMDITMEERIIIDSVLRYVANASGANPNEMFVDALTEIDTLIGDAS